MPAVTDSARPADLIFHGGWVHTVDDANSIAEAVAVRSGRIVAVGRDDEVRRWTGPRTEVRDLRGRSLVPGFGDAHVHVGRGGLDRLTIDLADATTVDEYGELVRGYADAHPEAEWLTGGGWSMTAFPGGTPTAAMLDRYVADRPVFLVNRDNHGAWVNSVAMRLAGIDAAAGDPPDGRIERDAAGEPTGCLHEGAVRLVGRLVPVPTDDDMAAALLEGQRYLHSLGITQWQDAIVGRYETMPDTYEAYRRIAADGRLTGRVVAALWLPRSTTEDDLELVRRRRAEGSVGRLRPTSVKIMADGVCENFTAAMLEPYLDADGRPTDNRGIGFFSPDELQAVIPQLDREGFDIHVHVIGDRACHDVLDALAAARAANGPADRRHHLAHLQVVHPADRPRFASLDATATFQPLWAIHNDQMDDLTIPYLGAERTGWQYPIGSLARSGTRLAFGSDWPISSPDPLLAIHVAVNRSLPAGHPYTDRPVGSPVLRFLPDERIDLATALRAYTMGTAFVNRLKDETGSIEVGKAADLAVLDRDLATCPPDELVDVRVVMTMVEGTPVYESGDL